MSEPIDIALIKGRQRTEDMRRLAAGEITREELQRENAIVQSAADILYVDLSPKGTPESAQAALPVSGLALPGH